ncbi:uncharacterized protein LOC126817869 [Patella vulgata]|uniref:uncharacterized protein LOC126817869 n=1 Tax=Patella vulgata TaxID=6465 RepID=UPI0021803752|nr:uncharacterized protein LOC126817869 [Patella vulgata]
MSVRKAAIAYGIPKSTLHDKLKEKTPLIPIPRTILSPDEENILAEWVINMSKIGYGRTKCELLAKVKSILDKDTRITPFKNNMPGKDWYYGFIRRHPNISVQIKDSTIYADPSRWYNADESGFPLCSKTCKVLAERGQKNIYNFTSSDKTQITVLAAMSTAGHYIKPLIVFPGQRFSYNPLEGFEEASFGRTENGWMDSELFSTWLRDMFIPEVVERGVRRPVVLFVDGHSTHLTLDACDLCRENGIVLYCLLEHASHLMQPCDLQRIEKEKLKEQRKLERERNKNEREEKKRLQKLEKETKKRKLNDDTDSSESFSVDDDSGDDIAEVNANMCFRF